MRTRIAELEIKPIEGPLSGSVKPPGSKSITNRALLIAALAQGQTRLSGLLHSEDTRVMIAALQKLGVAIESLSGSELTRPDDPAVVVQGCGGQLPVRRGELFLENSGTSLRFLTAALAAAGGVYDLDGIERMRQRPIGPLVNALSSLGANILALSPKGCPPIKINSGRLNGGRVRIDGSLSSQYVSGLLMAAPLMKGDLEITIEGDLVSRPYLVMTLKMMESFGVRSRCDWQQKRLMVPGCQTYFANCYDIEPDASAASYFWGAAAICGGKATVWGLNRNSLQGDIEFVKALEMMGCQIEYQADSISVIGPAKHGIEVDMSQISDTVQTLAAVALFVSGKTVIRNVAHNRIKETDRIADLSTELRKLGGIVVEHPDGLTISPSRLLPAKINTYNDHRMAMSLSLVGLKIPGIVITDPGCVSKTYPNFFEDLKRFVSQI